MPSLQQAAKVNDIAQAQACIVRGDDVNELYPDSYSPLHIAVMHQSFGVAELLLQKGAKVDIASSGEQPKTPLQCAINEMLHTHPASNMHLIGKFRRTTTAIFPIIRLLLNYGANIHYQCGTAWFSFGLLYRYEKSALALANLYSPILADALQSNLPQNWEAVERQFVERETLYQARKIFDTGMIALLISQISDYLMREIPDRSDDLINLLREGIGDHADRHGIDISLIFANENLPDDKFLMLIDIETAIMENLRAELNDRIFHPQLTMSLTEVQQLMQNVAAATIDAHIATVRAQGNRNAQLAPIDVQANHVNPANFTPPVNLRPAINTHTASVHKSATESATRLINRYGHLIEGEDPETMAQYFIRTFIGSEHAPTLNNIAAAIIGINLHLSRNRLDNIITNVVTYISNLPNDTLERQAAKRCIQDITHVQATFVDPISRVSLRQLIALCFIGIYDENARLTNLTDAEDAFVRTFYKIQRDKLMDDNGHDLGGDNESAICMSGSFNAVIEGHVSVLPDCELHFIDKKYATAKLPHVVQEEALSYLRGLANPKNPKEFLDFTQLISRIREDGLEVIWDNIKVIIADRMFKEFNSLFRNDPKNAEFKDFISAGIYVELVNLHVFQESIQNSAGYQQYCRQILTANTENCFLLLSRQQEQAKLSAERHNSAQNQRRYDQKYGLIKL